MLNKLHSQKMDYAHVMSASYPNTQLTNHVANLLKSGPQRNLIGCLWNKISKSVLLSLVWSSSYLNSITEMVSYEFNIRFVSFFVQDYTTKYYSKTVYEYTSHVL